MGALVWLTLVLALCAVISNCMTIWSNCINKKLAEATQKLVALGNEQALEDKIFRLDFQSQNITEHGLIRFYIANIGRPVLGIKKIMLNVDNHPASFSIYDLTLPDYLKTGERHKTDIDFENFLMLVVLLIQKNCEVEIDKLESLHVIISTIHGVVEKRALPVDLIDYLKSYIETKEAQQLNCKHTFKNIREGDGTALGYCRRCTLVVKKSHAENI